MTLFRCCCGRSYNSDTLKSCPYCGAPKVEQNDWVRELLKDEGFIIVIKEIAKRVVVEMDGDGFFDHDHTEGDTKNE